MPRVDIYIRKEDYDKWRAIENKPEFISEAINKLHYLKVRREKQLRKIREWEIANPEKKRTKTRENMRKYRQSEEARIKDRARSAVGNAIKKGVMVRPEVCSVCSGTGKIEAHHDDYSKQLEVKWICHPCHQLIHHP